MGDYEPNGPLNLNSLCAVAWFELKVAFKSKQMLWIGTFTGHYRVSCIRLAEFGFAAMWRIHICL